MASFNITVGGIKADVTTVDKGFPTFKTDVEVNVVTTAPYNAGMIDDFQNAVLNRLGVKKSQVNMNVHWRKPK